MSEMINNQELLDQQDELVGDGHWPQEPNEVVLVVGKNNRINTMALYMLGVLDQSELEDVMKELMLNGKYESNHGAEYDLDYFLNMEFYMVNEFQFYEENVDKPKYLDEYNTWSEIPLLTEEARAEFVRENGTKLVISGIIRPREDATAASISGAIGYTHELTEMILEMNEGSKIINQQKATPEYNVLTGLKFERTHYTPETIGELIDKTCEIAKNTTPECAYTGVNTSDKA